MRCQFHQILSRSNTFSSAIVSVIVGTVNFSRILQRLPPNLEDILGPVALSVETELKEIQNTLQHLQKHVDGTNEVRSHIKIGRWDSILFVLADIINAFDELEPLIGPLAMTTDVGVHGLAKWKVRSSVVTKILERIRQHKHILLLVVHILQR
jgi:hypothetical protein